MLELDDLDYLIKVVGYAQWSQRAITMLVLLHIRYISPITEENKDLIKPSIIVPIIFFLACTILVSCLKFKKNIFSDYWDPVS